MIKEVFPYKELFDSHSHISIIEADTKQIVKDAVDSGVSKIVAVSNDLPSIEKVLELKRKFPDTVLATAGIHPEVVIPGSDLFSPEITSENAGIQIDRLEKIIQDNPGEFAMLGETGLDYYWLEKNAVPKPEFEKSIELQKVLFAGHLALAKKYDLPLTIHARSSHKDCIDMVKYFSGLIKSGQGTGTFGTTEISAISIKSGGSGVSGTSQVPGGLGIFPLYGIFHSFTGTVDEAQDIFALGFAIGINGIISYKSAQTLRETILAVTNGKEIKNPADLYACGIYLETDSPFLIPSNIKEKVSYNSPKQISVLWNFVYNLVNTH
jgi:TatD DNase family protein